MNMQQDGLASVEGVLVTVIVPVFNVQGQVRKSLHSVLAQTHKNIEVVVVDDCSTDHSLEICVEVAKLDPRIHIVAHEVNKGLGAARNTGLDHASGDYILFVDSDDLVAPELVFRALTNATRNDSDVVMFNHARIWPQGGCKNNLRSDLFERLSGKALNSEERIEIFQNLNVAWNKLYKKNFVNELSAKFGEGYYEDIPWTYHILSLDCNITLENFVGYFYLQRPGSILNSVTSRHFEIFDRYQELFQKLKKDNVCSEFVDECFLRCVEHLLNMTFEKTGRVPLDQLVEFALQGRRFVLESASFLQLDIGSYHFESDPRFGRRYRVYMTGNHIAFRGFLLARRALRWAIAYKEDLRSRKKKLIKSLRREFSKKRLASLKLLYKYVLVRLPVNPRLAVFSAYWDKQVSCNPKAVADALTNRIPEIDQYWILRKEISAPSGYKGIEPDTLKYYYVLATAKYFVNNANFPNFLIKRPGQIHLQTKHGTPIKTMGFDQIRESRGANMSPRWLAHRCSRWDYVISSNRYSSEIWRGGFPFNYQLLEVGYPRNDFLVNGSSEDADAIKKRLGIPKDKLVILYAPTFRDYEKNHVPDFDPDRFLARTGLNAVVLVRSHYFQRATSIESSDSSDSVINVNNWTSIEELYCVSDILVSDYSSSVFDYLNLERPVFLYAYDYEEYREHRGIYMDLEAEFGSLFARSEAELAEKVKDCVQGSVEARKQVEQLASKYASFDDGNAANRVVEAVFEG